MSGIDYYDMTDEDLASELVGKKIVNIDPDTNTITLQDGTKLIFRDANECCAWFKAELKEKNLTDNAITHVTTTGEYVKLTAQYVAILVIDRKTARELGHIFLAAANPEGNQE